MYRVFSTIQIVSGYKVSVHVHIYIYVYKECSLCTYPESRIMHRVFNKCPQSIYINRVFNIIPESIKIDIYRAFTTLIILFLKIRKKCAHLYPAFKQQ